jgi:hypothetical protein
MWRLLRRVSLRRWCRDCHVVPPRKDSGATKQSLYRQIATSCLLARTVQGLPRRSSSQGRNHVKTNVLSLREAQRSGATKQSLCRDCHVVPPRKDGAGIATSFLLARTVEIATSFLLARTVEIATSFLLARTVEIAASFLLAKTVRLRMEIKKSSEEDFNIE